MVDSLTLLFLPALIFLGVVTSIEDVKFRRIRNKWVMFSLGYSCSILMMSFFFNQSSTSFVQRYALNIFFSFILGVIFWGAKIWSAGDAKLLVAYASLIPPSLFAYSSYFFPGIVLLCNILLPYLLFYMGKIILKTTWRMKWNTLKEIATIKNSSTFLLFTFAFSWIGGKISHIIRNLFPMMDSPITTMLIVIIIIVLVKDVYSMGLRRFCLALSAIALLADFNYISQSSFFVHFALGALIMFFLRGFILTLGYQILSRPIYLENLKAGMHPAENFVQFGRRGVIIRKVRVLPLGFLSAAPTIKGKFVNFMIRSPEEGLQRKEVLKIQQYHRERFIKSHTLRIYERVAFAPFLFLGVIITVLAKGKIIFGMLF